MRGIDEFEYAVLTDSWVGPKWVAYDKVTEDCKSSGFLKGFKDCKPVLTAKGEKAVAQYNR